MKRVLLKLSGEALAGDKKTGFVQFLNGHWLQTPSILSYAMSKPWMGGWTQPGQVIANQMNMPQIRASTREATRGMMQVVTQMSM